MIATYNTCGTYANTIQRHRKAGSAGKIASAGYGHNNRQAGHAIKGRRCDNQHRPRSLAELLAQCDPNAEISAEEREWLDAPATGQEEI
ncbi:hypothetical protein AWH01_16765 [Escherichia coli]|nr:hypothetical protein AWH01_16765 [Escherichia coli]